MKGYLLYVSIMLALFGVMYIIQGGKVLLRQRKLRGSGVDINAVVTSCTLTSEKYKTYRTGYKFHPVSGGEYHGEFVSNEQYAVGKIIPICYLPAEPNTHVVTSRLAGDRKNFYIGLGCFAAGLVLTGVFLYMSTMHRAPGVSTTNRTAQTFDDVQEKFSLPYGADIAVLGEDLYIARGTQKDTDDADNGNNGDNGDDGDNGQAAKKPGGITLKPGVVPPGGAGGTMQGLGSGSTSSSSNTNTNSSGSSSNTSSTPDTPSLLAVLPVSVLTERLGVPDSMTWEADRLSYRIDGPYDFTDSDDLYVWAEFFDGTGDQYVAQCDMLGSVDAKHLARGGSWACPGGTVTFSDSYAYYNDSDWSVYMASWLGMPGGGVLVVCAKVELIPHIEEDEPAYGGKPGEYFRETMQAFWEKVQVVTEDFDSVTVPGPYAKRRIASPNGGWAAHTAVGEWTTNSVENLALDEASVQYLTIFPPGMLESVLKSRMQGSYVSSDVDEETELEIGGRRITVYRISGDKVVGKSNFYRGRVDYFLFCEENGEYILANVTAEDTYELENLRELAQKILLPASLETGMEDEAYLTSPDRLEKVRTVLQISPDAQGIGAARDDLSEEKYIMDQDAEGKMTAAAVITTPDWGGPESVSVSNWNEDGIIFRMEDFTRQDDFAAARNNDVKRLQIEYEFMNENSADVLTALNAQSFETGGRQFHYAFENSMGATKFPDFTMWTKAGEGRSLKIRVEAYTEKNCEPGRIFAGFPQKLAEMVTIYTDGFDRITAAGPQASRRISYSSDDYGELVVWAPAGRDANLYHGTITEIGIMDNFPAELEISRAYSFEPATADTVVQSAGYHYYSYEEQDAGTVTAGDFTAEYKVIGGIGNRWTDGKRCCSCCVAVPINENYYLAITINSTGRSMMEDPTEMLTGYLEKIEAELTAPDGTVTQYSGRR